VNVRFGVALGWLGVVLATEHWRPWSDGIRLKYATDVEEYATIARAAPGFPAEKIQAPHADRFPAPWLVGELHKLTGVGIHPMFAILTALVLVATFATLHLALVSLRTRVATYAIVFGLVAATPYPVRLLLDAPGMLTDAIFVLGVVVTLLGFIRGNGWLVAAGLGFAEIGRQDAVPLAVVAALAVFFTWEQRRRVLFALLAVAVPAAVYVAAHEGSSSWSDRSGRGVVGMTAGGDWSVHGTASHIGRIAIALVLPVAVLVVARLRSGRLPLFVPLALGLTIVAEAFVLAPDWSHAEPRLAGVAIPALALAAPPMLDRAGLSVRQTLLCCVGIALASLHHIYSNVGFTRSSEWAAAVLAGCVCVGVLALRRQRGVHA